MSIDRRRTAKLVALLVAACASSLAGTARASEDAYVDVCDWLFQRYLERGVSTILRQAANDRPEARDALFAAGPRIVAALPVHRESFRAAMVPALRSTFAAGEIAAVSGRLRQVPLALDAETGRRLIAADAEFRRNGQQVMSAIGADIDLLVAEILASLRG